MWCVYHTQRVVDCLCVDKVIFTKVVIVLQMSEELRPILLLAGLPNRFNRFKDYSWCLEDANAGSLTDRIPDNVIVETIGPTDCTYAEATRADHATSLWDINFHETHKDRCDDLVLLDLSGSWYTVQYMKHGGYGVHFDTLRVWRPPRVVRNCMTSTHLQTGLVRAPVAVMILVVVDSSCSDAREECDIVWVAPLSMQLSRRALAL